MKAILRLPLLTKKYHDMIREQNMLEFDSLELIYAEHFNELGKEIKELGTQKRLSLAENELIKMYQK